MCIRDSRHPSRVSPPSHSNTINSSSVRKHTMDLNRVQTTNTRSHNDVPVKRTSVFFFQTIISCRLITLFYRFVYAITVDLSLQREGVHIVKVIACSSSGSKVFEGKFAYYSARLSRPAADGLLLRRTHCKTRLTVLFKLSN